MNHYKYASMGMVKQNDISDGSRTKWISEHLLDFFRVGIPLGDHFLSQA
jgi:hypothetical protein